MSTTPSHQQQSCPCGPILSSRAPRNNPESEGGGGARTTPPPTPPPTPHNAGPAHTVWRHATAPRPPLQAAHLDGAPTVGELPLEELKVDEPATPQAGTSPRLGLSGLESTLRIRFGDLDQLELGELIGRGGGFQIFILPLIKSGDLDQLELGQLIGRGGGW